MMLVVSCGAFMLSVGSAVAADPLVLTARLVASDNRTDPGGAVLFSSPGISGGVAVGGAPWATVGANHRQGAVYVFTEPSSGWSTETETARLIESDGKADDSFGSLAVISGDAIVASRWLRQGTPQYYVFTKPPGGWSGTLQETAQLTVSDPRGGGRSVAMSGDTIVIGADGYSGGYVFTKPAGGWSGTIHESATLTVPGASYPCFSGQGSVATDGPTIVASCSGHAYVFTKPASGWAGTIGPAATLLAPPTTPVASVTVLGSGVAAAVSRPQCAANAVVFHKPASGWSGTIRPAATLTVTPGCSQGVDELVAASGNEIAALEIPQNDQSCQIFLTCTATLNAFGQPLGGWKGTIAGASTDVGVATPAGEWPPAVEGRTIVTAGAGELDLFTAQPGPPSARNVSLTGVAAGKPKLRFTLDTDESAAAIRSIKLSLPRGLRFAKQPISLTRGVHTSAPKQALRSSSSVLTFSLRSPAQPLSVSVVSPALIAQQQLIAQLRHIREYNRHHLRKRTWTLRIRCAVTDATRHTTPVTLKVKIS